LVQPRPSRGELRLRRFVASLGVFVVDHRQLLSRGDMIAFLHDQLDDGAGGPGADLHLRVRLQRAGARHADKQIPPRHHRRPARLLRGLGDSATAHDPDESGQDGEDGGNCCGSFHHGSLRYHTEAIRRRSPIPPEMPGEGFYSVAFLDPNGCPLC